MTTYFEETLRTAASAQNIFNMQFEIPILIKNDTEMFLKWSPFNLNTNKMYVRLQRRIQNQAKHLRWSFFTNIPTF